MLRTLVLAVMAGWLAFAGPAQAQATADQLNKLSLESLTAPSPGGGGGGGGYRPTPHRRYASRAPSSYGRQQSYRAAPYRHAYRRSVYRRPVYRQPVYRGRSDRRPAIVHRSDQPHRSYVRPSVRRR